jgi:hypothetical protein
LKHVIEEETVPEMMMDNGLDIPFMVDDGDVWVATTDKDPYEAYFRQIMRN